MPHQRGLAWCLVVAGALVVIATTLTPSPGTAQEGALCVVCGPRGGVDLLLNLLLFVPLGLGAGLLGATPARALLLLGGGSTAIELLQGTIVSGRHASVRDIVLNAAGAWLGATLAARWASIAHPQAGTARRLAVAWGAGFVAVQAVGALLARPSVAPSRFYGHLDRNLIGERPLPALLTEATLSGLPIVDWGFADSADVRARLLREPLRVNFSLIPMARSVGTSPVFRVVDRERRELLLVAMRGRDIVLQPHTLASRARLRPVRFVLRDAFPDDADASGSDTLRFEGTYSRTGVTMRASWRGASAQRTYMPSAATAWAFASPVPVYAPGPLANILTMCWLAALLFPTAYWMRRAASSTHAALGALGIAALGLVAVPLATGLQPGDPTEWLAAGMGTVLGIALSSAIARRDAVRAA